MVTPVGKPGLNPEKDVSVPINWAYNHVRDLPLPASSGRRAPPRASLIEQRLAGTLRSTTAPTCKASTVSAKRSRHLETFMALAPTA